MCRSMKYEEKMKSTSPSMQLRRFRFAVSFQVQAPRRPSRRVMKKEGSACSQDPAKCSRLEANILEAGWEDGEAGRSKARSMVY